MVTEKGRKTFESEWNGQKGNFVLVADLKAGQIQTILRNVLTYDFEKGLTLSSVDYPEYIVQVSQKLIKQAPPGFDVNKPDNIRDLDPADWAQLEDFIAEHYPLMSFLSNGMMVLFGKNSLKQNSSPQTGST